MLALFLQNLQCEVSFVLAYLSLRHMASHIITEPITLLGSLDYALVQEHVCQPHPKEGFASSPKLHLDYQILHISSREHALNPQQIVLYQIP